MTADMIPAIAGIFSVIATSVNTVSAKRSFHRHAVLAASFLSGTLEMRPSKLGVVRPQIEGVYVVFILLPIAMALAFFFVALKTRE